MPLASRSSGVNLWREVQWLLHCGDVETAYERVLIDGNERDLLRVMAKTHICLHLLSPRTQTLLFTTISHMIQTDSTYVDHVLPWVLQATQAGDALRLPRPVRQSLVKALYHVLAQQPQPGPGGGGGSPEWVHQGHPGNASGHHLVRAV